MHSDSLPYVSILVPVYGVEDYIERCARSIFEQTYPDIEYIFVDDASPDRSIEVLERVMKDYPERIAHTQIIRHPRNRGLAAARNTALDHCQTEWLMHIDSDDYVEPRMVELLVGRQQETVADIVTGRALFHKGQEITEDRKPETADKDAYIYHVVRYKCSFLWNRIIRHSLYTEHQLAAVEGIDMGEDRMMLLQLLFAARSISFVDAFTYHYIDRSDSYMNRLKVQRDKNLYVQDFRAYRDVIRFIAAKNFPYKRQVTADIVKTLYSHLWIAAKNHDQTFYRDVRDIILQGGPECWGDPINWNRPLKRYIESHYHLMRLSMPLRRLRAAYHRA